MNEINAPFGIKWQPEHFPKGTLVRAKIPDPNIDPNQVYEVASIIRNAPLNHIIKTTAPCPYIDGNNATFALTYVTEVVKLGTGHVVMEPMYDTPTNKWQRMMADDVRLLRMTGVLDKSVNGHIHAKTQYLIMSGHDIIYFLMEKYGLNAKNISVDLSALTTALLTQSFIHMRRTKPSRYLPCGSVYAMTAPKKRVNRWFQQNFNRFLVTNKSAETAQQKAYDDYHGERDELDMEIDDIN